MHMATIIAYVATIAAVVLTVTALLQAVIGRLVGRMAGPLMGALIGAIVVWLGIDFLWIWLERGHVPIAALAAAIAALFVHGAISKEKLTEQSNWMMAGEAWAIILVGVYVAIVSERIRWY